MRPDNRTPVIRTLRRLGGPVFFAFVLFALEILAAPEATGQDAAQMIAPARSSKLPRGRVTFTWTAGTGVSQYWIYIGNAPRGRDILNQNMGTRRTLTVNLITDARSVYVTLWSLTRGGWKCFIYGYLTADTVGKATMISPKPGTAVSGPVSFQWTAAAGAREYFIYVGSRRLKNDLCNLNCGANRIANVRGLPTDGRTLYVTLWTGYLSGNLMRWDYNEYQYVAGRSTAAQITSPAPGSQLGSSSFTLSWSRGIGAAHYHLWVGSSPGGKDIFNEYQGQKTNRAVRVPQDGRRIYVTLWSMINDRWVSTSATFIAPKASSSTGRRNLGGIV